MIKCIIVDDEALSREIIQSFVDKSKDLEIVKTFSNALDAIRHLRTDTVDLIFLDINMPELSGIDLMKQLPEPPAVIFITAYSDFAVEGFELDAVDYLVKPVAFDRFRKAIDRFRNRTPKNESQHLILRADKRTYSISLDSISHLQSAGDYIKVNSTEHKLVINDTMKEMEQRLSSDFIRIHKSHIVNLKHMQYLEGNQIKINNQLLPIGAKYREQVLNRIRG